jgi:hypothetical protein
MRFLISGFSIKHLLLDHRFTSTSVFANNFELADIFKFDFDSAVSMTVAVFLQATSVFHAWPSAYSCSSIVGSDYLCL